MKVLVSGAGGFIGSVVTAKLLECGHSVIGLTRSTINEGADCVVWDPAARQLGALPETLDAVVHLAGENIYGRWTNAKKEAIRASRVKGTLLLAERLAVMRQKVKVFVCASAVGFYGNRGDAVLTETAAAGDGFLSRVCREWEDAAEPARLAGIRIVHLRLGMVLAKDGGALAKMLPAFKMGMGGVLGDGRQWVSWISLADAVRALLFVLEHESLAGPVNMAAPEPVQNREFTEVMGHLLHRPVRLQLPAIILRFIFREFADETLLASTRAVPEKLMNAGFRFEYPGLEQALSVILK